MIRLSVCLAAAGLGALTLLLAQPAGAAPLYSIQELHPLPGNYKVQALALNAAGQVVGWSRAADGTNSAVLWQGRSVVNLSPESQRDFSHIATDINDHGQIVGFGVACGEDCGAPEGPGLTVQPWMGDGPWAALAPGSTAPLPSPGKCQTDGKAWLISNAGYVLADGGSLTSPHEDNLWCLGAHITDLYENGIIVTSTGYMYETFVDIVIHTELGFVDTIDARTWVLAEGCNAGQHAYPSFGPLWRVSDALQAEVCHLIATGYSRDRTRNAAGQFIANVEGRAFLFTPVSVPGTPLLLSLALCLLALSRHGPGR